MDRDLVGTWWIRDRQFYIDFKHARGGFPNEGKVRGAAVRPNPWGDPAPGEAGR